MANKLALRELRLDEKLRAEIHEYAYQQRKSVAEVIREVVSDFMDDVVSEVERTRKQTRIKFRVDPDEWDRALERAQAQGVSLSPVLRAKLAALVRHPEE